jgi:hypothetical protein
MNPAQLINSSTAPLEERSRAPSSPAEDIGDDSHGGAGVSSLSYPFALRLRDYVLAEMLREMTYDAEWLPPSTPRRPLTYALTDEVLVMECAYFGRQPLVAAACRMTHKNARSIEVQIEVRLS